MAEKEVATTWAQLLQKPDVDQDLEFLEEHAESMAPTDRSIGTDFGEPAEVLAELAVVLGPDECKDEFARFAPFVPAAMKEVAGDVVKRQVNAIEFMRYLNVAACCDVELQDSSQVEARLLPQFKIRWGRAALGEERELTVAFAALAAGAIDLVPIYADGGPLAATIQPGEKFGFNVQAFIRYLATASAQKARAQDVRPAWLDFFASFPLKLAAGTLEWVHLLYAARSYYVHFENRPVAMVANAVHRLATTEQD
jgi:hypothetical protein